MRILFCADTFPGRFGPLAAAFAAAGHEVLFASHYGRRDFALPGVKRVLLKPVRIRRSDQTAPGEPARLEWNKALTAAHLATDAFVTLRKRGFVPDMAVFSAGSGAALALSQSFPEAVLFGFADAMHARATSEEAETARLLMRACLAQSHACFAFSEQHLHAMPPLLRRSACLLPPAVDTEFFSPEAAQPFVWEGAEPYELVTVDLRSVPAASSRGLWNLCASLFAHRPQCRILMNCSENYVREAAQGMAQVLPEIWQERLRVQDFKSLHEWRDILCASDVHIVPEALSGSSPLPEVLEAMSCGTLLAVPEEAVPGIERYFQALRNATCKDTVNDSAGENAAQSEFSAHKDEKFLPRVSQKKPVVGQDFDFSTPLKSDSHSGRLSTSDLSYRNTSLFLLPLSRHGTAVQLNAVTGIFNNRIAADQLKKQARSVIVELCIQTRTVPVQFSHILEIFRLCRAEQTAHRVCIQGGKK